MKVTSRRAACLGASAALGPLASMVFAIAASVAPSVAGAASPPQQCPAGTIPNLQTHACDAVKAPAPVIKEPIVHVPVNSGKPPPNCNGHGSGDSNGGCLCEGKYSGPSCNLCATNYYGYPDCTYALAATTCTGHGILTSNGSCSCNAGYTGGSCNSCATNYSGYPSCQTGTNGDAKANARH
jgi:hypothetical protein